MCFADLAGILYWPCGPNVITQWAKFGPRAGVWWMIGGGGRGEHTGDFSLKWVQHNHLQASARGLRIMDEKLITCNVFGCGGGVCGVGGGYLLLLYCFTGAALNDGVERLQGWKWGCGSAASFGFLPCWWRNIWSFAFFIFKVPTQSCTTLTSNLPLYVKFHVRI